MKTQLLRKNNILTNISSIISILFLFMNIVYADSDSNCHDYDMIKNQSRIEISFQTLDNMLSESDGNTYEILKKIMKDLNDKDKDLAVLKGASFFYNLIDNKAENCDIFYRFKNQPDKKMWSFPRDENNDCTGLIQDVVCTFLWAKKKRSEKNFEPYKIEYSDKIETISTIDPTLLEINIALGRHPELENVFKRKKVKFIEIPIPAATYVLNETIWERSGLANLKEAMPLATQKEKNTAIMMTAKVFNPKTALSETEDFGRNILLLLPVPIRITKYIADETETYEIKEGDILEEIAKNHYGYKSFWGIIYQINRDKIKNPNKLIPGSKIWVPKKDNLILPPLFTFLPFKHVSIE